MQKIISCRCTGCQQDITFIVPDEKIQRGAFPILLENVHGSPPHKFTILVTRTFQVRSLLVEETTAELSRSTSTLEELFRDLGLTDEEREFYLQCIKIAPLSLGDLVKKGKLFPDSVRDFTEKLVKKGFFKRVEGTETYFQPLPPYVAILYLLEQSSTDVQNITESLPREIEQIFASLEQQVRDVQDPRDIVNYVKIIINSASTTIKAKLGPILSRLNRSVSVIGKFWDTEMEAPTVLFTEPNLDAPQMHDTEEVSVTPPSVQMSPSSRSALASSKDQRPKSIPSQRISPSDESELTRRKTLHPEIAATLDEFIEKMPTFESPNVVASIILDLRDRFQKLVGFNSVFHDMVNWSNQLRHGFTWDEKGQDVIKRRIEYWRDKLAEVRPLAP